MRNARAPIRKHRQMEDVILFKAAGTRFAIPAAVVEEIRGLDGLAPFAMGIAHSRFAKVTHTLSREVIARDRAAARTALYFVVDVDIHVGALPTRHSRVLVLRDLPVALLVEGIERMTQIARVIALPLAFHGEERKWYRGLAVLEEKVVPVIDPTSFLNCGEIAVLQAGYRNSQMLAQGAWA